MTRNQREAGSAALLDLKTESKRKRLLAEMPYCPRNWPAMTVSSERMGESRYTLPFWLCMADKPLRLFDEWPCVVLS